MIAPEDLKALRAGVTPVLQALCDSQSLHAFIDGKAGLDQAVWAAAIELGWLGVGLPEAHGGLGFGSQGLDVLHDELGRRLAPGPFIATLSAAQWLSEVASETLKAALLPQVVTGELVIAIPAIFGSGPVLGLHDGRLQGGLRVLGAEAPGLIVAPVGTGAAVDGWALIRREDSAVTLSTLDTWDRTRCLFALSCEGAVPLAVIEDPSGSAGRALARHVALALASDSVGAAAAVADQTVEYLKSRVQFDRPIGSFQALKHRAADLAARIETNRRLVEQAVEACALQCPDADLWVALAKAGASEAYAFVAGDCVQLHGGVGHTWEFDLHIHVKRARLNQALGASNRAHLDIAAEALAEAVRAGRRTTELAL